MNITPTSLPEVLVIEPKVFGDARGFFFESYHEHKYLQAGIDARFVQDNHSRSARGILRGLHFQVTKPQGKLCRVARGEVFDVAIDIRPDSPRFGMWAGVVLSEENQKQIWVPRGFAHGFLVLSESADFLYKCDEFYDPSDEGGIRWDDPEIGIEWPEVQGEILLSGKDKVLPALKEIAQERLPKVG